MISKFLFNYWRKEKECDWPGAVVRVTCRK
jgi:hypothetical protein